MIVAMYTSGKNAIVSQAVDLVSDTIKVALLKDTYTFDPTEDYWADISTHEVTPNGGYSAGGATLADGAFTIDDANEQVMFDATDVTWAANTIADIQYIIIYKPNANPALAQLIGCIDNETPFSTTAQSLIISWAALGVMRAL